MNSTEIIKRYNQEVKKLRRKIDLLVSENENLKGLVEKLSHPEKTDLEKELCKQISKIENENRKLQREINKLNKEHNTLKEENDELKKHLEGAIRFYEDSENIDKIDF